MTDNIDIAVSLIEEERGFYNIHITIITLLLTALSDAK